MPKQRVIIDTRNEMKVGDVVVSALTDWSGNLIVERDIPAAALVEYPEGTVLQSTINLRWVIVKAYRGWKRVGATEHMDDASAASSFGTGGFYVLSDPRETRTEKKVTL